MTRLRTTTLGSSESSVVLRCGQVVKLLGDHGDVVLVQDPSGQRHSVAKRALRIAPGQTQSLPRGESEDIVIPNDVPDVTPIQIGPTIASTSESPLLASPDERRERARRLFEAWINTGAGKTVLEIDEALPHLARRCGLDTVSLEATDDERDHDAAGTQGRGRQR